MREVQVVGGGPAGTMAALAAMRAGASRVRIFEKSAFPRHKVCGEFLSPAILTLLRRAGCEAGFLELQPAVLREMRLQFGSRHTVRHPLPEPAFGLSRYELDRLLLQHAVQQGAEVVRETRPVAREDSGEEAVVLATGRRSVAPPGDRLFGFKAHFAGGPVNDAVELYFFDGCYAGVSAIEGGMTNVCGLAPEGLLRASGFDGGELLGRSEALSARLRGLTRQMDWLVTGPLVFSEALHGSGPAAYPAGDALGFIDPFTGSGIFNAMLTGEMAGDAAARGGSVEKYLRDCRRTLRRPFFVSSIFRAVIRSGYAGVLASFVPGRLLFAATRPGLAVR